MKVWINIAKKMICVLVGVILLTGLTDGKTVVYAEEEPVAPVVTDVPPENVTEPPQTAEPAVPSAKPKEKKPRLKPVSGVKLTRYSTNSVIVSWKKNKKAKYYRVYYAKKKHDSGRLAGRTKDASFRVKGLKNNTTYYFYIKACTSKKPTASDSVESKRLSMKTKTYIRKTIFAGDSITQEIAFGDTFHRMKFQGKKKVVAAVGLNTVTFHTKHVFLGKTGLQKLIAEKPSRVYMMLGMNEIHYRPWRTMIAEYRDMIREIRRSSPNTDIVLCAVSPVTKAEKQRHPGHWQIPVFNSGLKKLAKQMKIRYFDYTGFLKDAKGYLKASYATGDGYHWKSPAYVKFAEVVTKYERTINQ